MLALELAYGVALLAFAAWAAYQDHEPVMAGFAAFGSGCCGWLLTLNLGVV